MITKPKQCVKQSRVQIIKAAARNTRELLHYERPVSLVLTLVLSVVEVADAEHEVTQSHKQFLVNVLHVEQVCE